MEIIELNDANFEESISKGKVLVDFYATWCGPCKMLEPFLKQVASEVEGVTFYKVDVDQAKATKAKYNIMSVPTLILFNNGVMSDIKMGFMDKNQILDMIEGN